MSCGHIWNTENRCVYCGARKQEIYHLQGGEMELDCGDNSCLFATNKTGMRTNGGCRCIPPGNSKLSIKVQELLNEIRRQNATIAALKAERDALLDKVERVMDK